MLKSNTYYLIFCHVNGGGDSRQAFEGGGGCFLLEKIGIIRSKPPPGSLLPGPLGHMPRFKVPNMKCLPPGPTSWSHQCKNMSDGSHGSPPPYYLLANEHAKFLHKSARELIHHDSGLMKEAGRTFCNHRGLNRGRFVLICTLLYVLLCVRTFVLVRRYFCNHRGGEQGADLRP